MGIRFFCPNCDRRLHVKDYLAGKRGICPHCDESIVIPKESTILESEGPESLSSIEKVSASGLAHDTPQGLDQTIMELPSAATSGEAGKPRTDKASSSKTPVDKTAVEQTSSEETPPEETPSGKKPAGPQAGSGVLLAADAAAELDPIAAGMHLIWYVRPPSGGQYGPAEGDVMRQWVTEGRVTSDSLVWQEGWEEWRTASEVFPQLSPPPAEPERRAADNRQVKTAAPAAAAEPGTEVKVDRSKVKMLEYRLNRSRGKGKEIAAVAVLGIICVILVVLLGFVITKQF